jgi:hypothetical protein
MICVRAMAGAAEPLNAAGAGSGLSGVTTSAGGEM